MKRVSGLICVGCVFGLWAFAQTTTSSQSTATNISRPARVLSPAMIARNAATEKDHQNMMEQLHITSLRPGRNGMDSTSLNYANYDEAKANPFPNLPDPLTLKNGNKVTTPKVWWGKRRPEIVEDFDREVYGRVPKNVPKVTWEVVSITHDTVSNIPCVTKKIVGHVDNSSYLQDTVNIQLTLTIPASAAGPVPVIMQFSGFGFAPRPVVRGANGTAPAVAPPRFTVPPRGKGPKELLIEKGWGYAALNPGSIQADDGAGLTKGIIGFVNKGEYRKPDDWGSLRAWAWGADRALDYFETDKSVNAKEIGIEGHSRYGKAAIVTLAYDPRMAIAYVSSSGEAGAKLSRRNAGEVVENITGSGEYHWMAGNFLKYGGPLNWGDLPVDAHELIALCAPRPIFISAGAHNGDAWVDARGMFMAADAAGPVYKLLGKKDMGTHEFPHIETLLDGDIAFRQHTSGHTDGPNWPYFIAFAGKYFK